MAIVNGWVALPVLVATLLVFGWKTSNIKFVHRVPGKIPAGRQR
jgi:hypothetical protein